MINYKIIETDVLGIKILTLKKRFARFFWKTIVEGDWKDIDRYRVDNNISDDVPILFKQKGIFPI